MFAVVKEIHGAGNAVNETTVSRKYEKLTCSLIERDISITTMESCTSGQVASLITDTEGSSAILKGAFITYSNEAKIRQGVRAEIIDTYGVYSAETATAMAEACRAAYGADLGIGITGSFGNTDPNNADSIPGEAFFAIATVQGTESFHCSIPVQSSRRAYKFYIADVIGDCLLSRISGAS